VARMAKQSARRAGRKKTQGRRAARTQLPKKRRSKVQIRRIQVRPYLQRKKNFIVPKEARRSTKQGGNLQKKGSLSVGG